MRKKSYLLQPRSILSTQKRVAELYFDDENIGEVCPPLCALFDIMLRNEGVQLHDSKICVMFSWESLLGSDWYRARLEAKRKIDRSLARRTYARRNPLPSAATWMQPNQKIICRNRSERWAFFVSLVKS